MCKRLIYLISIVLVLGVVVPSSANADDLDSDLAGWWKFDDEGTGTVSDYSGNNRTGTLMGSARFVPGLFGDAVEITRFDDRVEIIGYQGVTGTQSRTVSAWIKTETTGEIVSWGANSAGQKWVFRVQTSNGAAGAIRIEVNGGYAVGSTDVRDGQWHHVAAALADDGSPDANEIALYVDGVQEAISAVSDQLINTASSTNVRIGEAPWHYRPFVGLIDELRIYDRALTLGEIQQLASPPVAYKPTPVNGSVHGNTWAPLSWSSGVDLVEYDVYIGESLAAVEAGTGGTYIGRQSTMSIIIGLPTMPYPNGLVPGATYYWRVDGVEANNSVHKGEVWTLKINGRAASEPDPADNARYVDTGVKLGWRPGLGAAMHYVYFGDNSADVEAGTGETSKGSVTIATYDPGQLERGTTYYWRVDESDGSTTHKGDVWRFRTRPVMPIRDPNLVGWWKMDDEGTGTVIDYSGYDRDGTLYANAGFAPGYDGDALMLRNDSPDYVRITGYKGVLRITNNVQHAFSITAWVRTGTNGEIVGWGQPSGGQRVEFRLDAGELRVEHGNGNVIGSTTVNDNQWHHVALTVKEGATISYPDVILWLDGEDDTVASTDTDTFNLTSNHDVTIGVRYNLDDSRWLYGWIDDVRIYDRVLTQEEIRFIMLRPDPMRSWSPSPADGSTPDMEHLTPLSWSPGDTAAKHDVYLGTDELAVVSADTSDTTGIYRDRQNLGNDSYTPPVTLEFGQTYYWRIDEVAADLTTIFPGRVWSFTVGDFIVVDDFEAYDANDNQIWHAWHDGLGYGTQDSPPYYAGNGTGSAVGDETTASYTEETIVHGGDQSMPYSYNNSGSTGKLNYSEATLMLTSGRDWTRKGVKALSLWFRGYSESVGSFTEDPVGTYTMTASGEDIWNVGPGPGEYHDEFHFAYKQLSGAGTIIAKVDSVQNTNNWAKAGVMIRDTLDPSSVHAMIVVTPAQGVSFQRRSNIGDSSSSTTQAGITAPQWVKIERDMGGNITVSYSADSISWTQLGVEIISMDTPMYIGLALTAHNVNATCEAVFSNVTITGMVGEQWMNQDIGILSNDPEPMYVAVANNTGPPAVVYHDDPNATRIDTWTEWNIDLKEFAQQGVNLSDVNSIAIGFGNRNNPQPGGSGTMYFDDIRLSRPRCVPSLLKPAADFSSNCIVDMADVEIMTDNWLISDYDVTAEAASDANLVLHYEFEGNANDSSGNGNHGDPNGGVSYTAGKIGQAISLDGIDDYVAIQNLNYASTGLTEVTVCAWIRTSNPFDQAIASFDRNEYWRFEINGNGAEDGQLSWCVMTSGGQVDFGSRNRVDDGQWHHVTGVFDNGTLGVFIDGKLDNSTSGGNTFGTGNIRYGFVGSRSEADVFDGPTGVPWVFAGDLDDVRIYERALSQAEIANLAGLPAGEILHQPLQGLLSTIENVDLHDDERIDFKDFAVLADMWLDEQLWPAP